MTPRLQRGYRRFESVPAQSPPRNAYVAGGSSRPWSGGQLLKAAFASFRFVSDASGVVHSSRPIAGLAPGMVEPVLAALASSSVPLRRRKLLAELDRRGHRISLAGLNRILQHCTRAGLTTEGPDGIRRTERPA